MVAENLFYATNSLADASDIEASNNQFSIRKISTNVDYTETGTLTTNSATGTLDTETGNVSGYAWALSWMDRMSHFYCEVGYDQSNGGTKYTGMNITGGGFGSVIDISTARLTNSSIRLGKALLRYDDLMLTPYVELGTHKWERGVNSGESYANNWLGIGALGQFSPASHWVVTANAMLGGTEGSAISVNSGSGITGFSAALGNSAILNLGLSADYALTQSYHVSIGVDYTGFNYGVSHVVDANGGSLEPDSKTHYSRVKFGLGYAF